MIGCFFHANRGDTMTKEAGIVAFELILNRGEIKKIFMYDLK